MSEATTIFATRANATPLPTTDELMKLARKAAPDPSVFDEHAPYFFRAVISNNSLDSYGTRMAPSSLKNYAKEAKRVVSLQNSHRTDDLGIGHSLNGLFEEEGEVARTIADFCILSGLSDTDPVITKMRAGTARDVSIGFHGGEWVCSICGGDMMDWRSCYHMLLARYEIEGGGTKRIEVATADVEDAHLSEVSPVYDGATTGAEIIALMKGEREIREGRLTEQNVRLLERQLRINIPRPRVQTTGTGERQMPDPTEETRGLKPEALKAFATRAGVKEEHAKDAESLLAAMADECVRLRPLADDGTKFREETVTAALDEGVRAFGNDFQREQEKATLEALPIAHVKRTAASWKAIADASKPAGRQTTDNVDTETTRTSAIPAAAYGA